MLPSELETRREKANQEMKCSTKGCDSPRGNSDGRKFCSECLKKTKCSTDECNNPCIASRNICVKCWKISTPCQGKDENDKNCTIPMSVMILHVGSGVRNA